MSSKSKNSFLLLAIIIGIVSLPTTWFQVTVPFPEGPFTEISRSLGQSTPATFTTDIVAINASISDLGGLPYWGILLLIVLGALIQIFQSSQKFNFPMWSALVLGILGFAAVSLPVISGIFTEAEVVPRFGWFMGLFSSSLPLVVFAMPVSENPISENLSIEHAHRGLA